MTESGLVRAWQPWAAGGIEIPALDTTRYCACGTRLSRYNHSRTCSLCRSKEIAATPPPTCACGCGTPTRKHKNGSFNRYASGHHEHRTIKLTYERAQEIRAIAADGARFADIAREFGVATTTVSDVVRGKTWAVRKEAG